MKCSDLNVAIIEWISKYLHVEFSGPFPLIEAHVDRGRERETNGYENTDRLTRFRGNSGLSLRITVLIIERGGGLQWNRTSAIVHHVTCSFGNSLSIPPWRAPCRPAALLPAIDL